MKSTTNTLRGPIRRHVSGNEKRGFNNPAGFTIHFPEGLGPAPRLSEGGVGEADPVLASQSDPKSFDRNPADIYRIYNSARPDKLVNPLFARANKQ